MRHSRPSHDLSNRSPYRIVETLEEREGFLQQFPIVNFELIANLYRGAGHNTHVSGTIPARTGNTSSSFRKVKEPLAGCSIRSDYSKLVSTVGSEDETKLFETIEAFRGTH